MTDLVERLQQAAVEAIANEAPELGRDLLRRAAQLHFEGSERLMVPTDFLGQLNESFMPDQAAILRATTGTPTGDGTPVSWAAVATVACRLSPRGNTANEALGGSGGMQSAAPLADRYACWHRCAGNRPRRHQRTDLRGYRRLRRPVLRDADHPDRRRDHLRPERRMT